MAVDFMGYRNTITSSSPIFLPPPNLTETEIKIEARSRNWKSQQSPLKIPHAATTLKLLWHQLCSQAPVVVNVNESFQSSSSPIESSNGPDSTNGLPSIDFSDSPPPLPTICTDVNVVPEHKKNELQQTISNLGGEITQLFQNDPDLAQVILGNDLNGLQELLRERHRQKSELKQKQDEELVKGQRQRRRLWEPIFAGLEKITVKTAGDLA
ncbi:hypothetical protein TB2_034342 [Malus domestica]